MYRFKCNLCSKDYNHQQSLYRHVKNIHHYTRFPCKSCLKTFISEETLDRHIKITSYE